MASEGKEQALLHGVSLRLIRKHKLLTLIWKQVNSYSEVFSIYFPSCVLFKNVGFFFLPYADFMKSVLKSDWNMLRD